MDPAILSTLANLGGAVVITGMFLWYLHKRDDKHEQLVKQVERTNEDFRLHNRALVEQFIGTTREQHAQMQSIMGDHMKVTRDNAKALTELKVVVETLRDDVRDKGDDEGG